MGIDSFDILKTLGEGAFASVHKVGLVGRVGLGRVGRRLIAWRGLGWGGWLWVWCVGRAGRWMCVAPGRLVDSHSSMDIPVDFVYTKIPPIHPQPRRLHLQTPKTKAKASHTTHYPYLYTVTLPALKPNTR